MSLSIVIVAGIYVQRGLCPNKSSSSSMVLD
uniref:Uncharacterized protein n=1 Tax=Rhizophora mucronata TaxID=61149 RepID=A0A2P2PPJ3_RHIMU